MTDACQNVSLSRRVADELIVKSLIVLKRPLVVAKV